VRDKLTARGLDAPSAEYIPTYPGVASTTSSATTLVKVEGPDFYGVFMKYLQRAVQLSYADLRQASPRRPRKSKARR